MASTDIPAILLEGGRISDSSFAIPLTLNEVYFVNLCQRHKGQSSQQSNPQISGVTDRYANVCIKKHGTRLDLQADPCFCNYTEQKKRLALHSLAI